MASDDMRLNVYSAREKGEPRRKNLEAARQGILYLVQNFIPFQKWNLITNMVMLFPSKNGNS